MRNKEKHHAAGESQSSTKINQSNQQKRVRRNSSFMRREKFDALKKAAYASRLWMTGSAAKKAGHALDKWGFALQGCAHSMAIALKDCADFYRLWVVFSCLYCLILGALLRSLKISRRF
jgi:hypothetical protein